MKQKIVLLRKWKIKRQKQKRITKLKEYMKDNYYKIKKLVKLSN